MSKQFGELTVAEMCDVIESRNLHSEVVQELERRGTGRRALLGLVSPQALSLQREIRNLDTELTAAESLKGPAYAKKGIELHGMARRAADDLKLITDEGESEILEEELLSLTRRLLKDVFNYKESS